MVEVIQTELSSGTTLCGGKYVIEKKIGAGGFGITYIARHTTLDRKYAIKEFFISGYNVRNNVTNHVSLQGLDIENFDKVRQNFINEARTLAHLNNDAVVKVIDIFDENGTSYMVMPFVEGVTLQSMVEKDGPMEYEMAVNYMVQICEALTYIHSKSILHRDVTPDNVIVTPEQKIVLIDFGSARKFVDGKTQRQTTIVKPGYAPLEQHSARSRKGAFTDLYSVGAVFYFLLTGERPMDATERVLERMKEPIELNPDVPPQINAIIMKAMEMDGEMRYQSAKELIDDIFSDESPDQDDGENTNSEQNPEIAPDTSREVAQETKSIQEISQEITAPQEKREEEETGIKATVASEELATIPQEAPELSQLEEQTSKKEEKETKERRGTLLKVVAIIFALVAVVVVFVVTTKKHPFNSSDRQKADTEQSCQVIEVEEKEAEEITLDSLMQQLMSQNSEIILQKLLSENSKDPVALFAVAKKANDGMKNDMMKVYWDQVLVPEGDVDRHLTASKTTFGLPKFAFVCGARAYESIEGSDYPSSVKQELKASLTLFLDSVRQINPTVLVYEKIE